MLIPTLYIVDRPGQGLALQLQDAQHYATESYFSGAAFLESVLLARPCCLVVDAHLNDMTGVELLARIRRQSEVPAILTSENWDPDTMMCGVRLGVRDFCTKPSEVAALRPRVQQILRQEAEMAELRLRVEEARDKLSRLTVRQRELMALFVSGLTQKEIAARLGISTRTVENHRAHLNARLGTRRLSEQCQLHLIATGFPSLYRQGVSVEMPPAPPETGHRLAALDVPQYDAGDCA